MQKLVVKYGLQTGIRALLDAMVTDKIHLARFILDVLDDKIVNVRTHEARTPLMEAVLLQEADARARFVVLLLERGANVNCQDDVGRTALSYSCEVGCLHTVKALVQKNADPELEDVWGNTALIYATVAGHSAVVEFLVRAFKRFGLDIDRANMVGNSALHIARYMDHQDCALVLNSQSKKDCESELLNLQEGENKQSRVRHNEKQTVAELVQQQADPKFEIPSLHHLSVGPFLEKRTLPTLDRNRSLIFRRRLESMDLINEEKRGTESCSDSPAPVLSSLPTPIPRIRSWSVQYGNISDRQVEKVSDGCFPPLSNVPSHYSPTRTKSAQIGISNRSGGPTYFANNSSMLNHLDILLTPIAPAKACRDNFNWEKTKHLSIDAKMNSLSESYYKKRSSLPNSVFSPTPPDRTILPRCKAKNLNLTSNPQLVPSASNSPSSCSPRTTFVVFGNKLLRRFTFPDFREQDTEGLGSVGGTDGTAQSCPEVALGSMLPRSETFPLSKSHQQVGSKPSIDGISEVKCEFDFQFKKSTS
ncbi:uncharacterized protein LOC122789289 [Protopterus annectens]|uniref:uncharacterized protein LOC122789289 n=1 Tax=Protopterus annectens TaxID=7888 RepID=UPI001CFADE09|nr:uncharacterized protein LOC122789289 [Protopterus annectens]